MSSSKLLKIADRILQEDKVFFDTLQEFEATKKVRSKMRMNFSIDKSTGQKFRRFCQKHGYNMSALIEKAIDEIMQ